MGHSTSDWATALLAAEEPRTAVPGRGDVPGGMLYADLGSKFGNQVTSHESRRDDMARSMGDVGVARDGAAKESSARCRQTPCLTSSEGRRLGSCA